MEGNKLDCCVVRDLLPAYLEDLTEEDTARQVRDHLAGCAACRAVEEAMEARLPVRTAPRRALGFLKRVRRTRLLATALTVILTLWCMWWLYDREFHYPNTQAGRQAAVEDYLSPFESEDVVIRAGAWQEREGHLLIFYRMEDGENSHGVLHLTRGINGKYRPCEARTERSALRAGVYSGFLSPRETDWHLRYLAGDGCRDIYAVQVTWWGGSYDGLQRRTAVQTYEITQPEFLWLMEEEELIRSLGWEPGRGEDQVQFLDVSEVRLLDREGNDVTAQYSDGSLDSSGGSGIGSAEQFLLYWYLGIVGVLGIILVRYFLRRD